MAINLFDPNFYRQANPDLAGFSNDAAFAHFINLGVNEGRRFSPFVDLNVYRAANPDLAAAGLTTNRQLHDHLSLSGVAEGRAFSNVIDVNFYRAANPDLAAVGLNNEQLLDHFRTLGLNEGRAASPIFNPGLYLAANPDLAAAGFSLAQGLNHYVQFGMAEGRAIAPGGGGTPPPPPPPVAADTEPNNEVGQAVNIDVLTGTVNIEGNVNFNDRDDFYRFRLLEPSRFFATVDGTTAFTDLTLFEDINGNNQIDSNERVFDSSGRSIERSRTLGAGTYFVQVESDSAGRNTNYTLGLTATVTSQAVDLGSSSSARTVEDFVGRSDREDIYRFILPNPTQTTISIGGATEFVSVALFEDINGNNQIDSNERVTDFSSNSNNSFREFTRELSAGTYFIVVGSDLGENSNYTLSFMA